jgi:asparagine synthase (glutamine-hydrolysing)
VCGIFGYVKRGGDGDPPSLARAIASLRHRGPDGEGTFEDVAGDARCGLAHTRLAIIDTSPLGAQPMTTADRRFTIVYNGEIYNYQAIRSELQASGDVFETGSDTEVVLAAYRRWGVDAIQRLRGMFALAIWDAQDASLFVARDRLGVKPLYIARGRSVFAFASEIRTLMETGVARRRLGAAGLGSFLAFGSASEPRTVLEDVEMLPGGCFGALRDGDFVVRRYWEPPYTSDESLSRESLADDTRALLMESVALRLVADVPVSIFLSGGMDSSSIVALASQVATRPLQTFTVSFDEPGFDEARYAEIVARRFGTEHRVVRLSATRVLDEIDDAMAALDQPSADGPNSYFVSKAVRAAGTRVALSGLGGDELFAGYANFRRFRDALRAQSLVPEPVASAIEAGVSSGALRVPIPVQKLAALASSRGDPWSTYAVLRGMFGSNQRRALASGAADDGCSDDPSELSRHAADAIATHAIDSVSGFGLLELSHYLRNTLLRDADVMGMAHALEIREPLLDHVLVERIVAVPGQLKIRRNANKPLLAAAVPELPLEATRRSKMGFTLPFESWLRGPLRRWAEQRLLAERPAQLGVDPREVARMWSDFLRGSPHVSWARIWTLVALVDWCERHHVSA